MYIHVDNSIFERWPLLGVLLGLAGFCLGAFGLWIMVQQYQRFGPEPKPVSVDQATPPEDYFDLGPWVTLQGELRLHCERVLQWRRNPPESWFFGNVESTYIPATNDAGDRFFLIRFGRDVTCDAVSKGLISGVLTGVNSRLRSTLSEEGLNFPPTQVPPMLLDTDVTPNQTKLYAGGLVLIQIASLWLLRRFWKKYRAKKVVAEFL